MLRRIVICAILLFPSIATGQGLSEREQLADQVGFYFRCVGEARVMQSFILGAATVNAHPDIVELNRDLASGVALNIPAESTLVGQHIFYCYQYINQLLGAV